MVTEPPVVSPLVLAEIDYMVHDRVGVDQELAVIDDLTSGAYEIADLDVDDLRTARGLAAQHLDLTIGITDALNAVLADRYDTNELLKIDQRHFRAVTPLSRRFDAFRLRIELLSPQPKLFPYLSVPSAIFKQVNAARNRWVARRNFQNGARV